MEGGARTVSVSLAVLPVPPLVDETLPDVLLLVPLVVAVTSTVTVHEPLAAMEPPLREIEVSPATGLKVPPQEFVAFGVAATSVPAGNESVKATPVRVVPAFGFVIVKVNVLTPPTAIGSGE
jgi:hypothetical protein